jgi:hypothetical protein
MKLFDKRYNAVTLICFWLLAILILSLIQPGCRKLVEAKPPVTSLSEANVYTNDVSAISVLTGIYQQMSQSDLISGARSISLMAGLSADEFTLSSAVSSADLKYYHYIDSLFSNTNLLSTGTQYWSQFFNWIYRCNAAIEGITTSTALTPPVQQQLLGEAKFMRAFFYFYLVNLYGDVPLLTNADWQINVQVSRAPTTQVYQQIIRDLTDAQHLLSNKYLDANLQPYAGIAERVRPTSWAATALLARTYLYMGDWVHAEAQATTLINSSLYSLPSLGDAFLKNKTEAIWQLQPVVTAQNTNDAILFLLPASGPNASLPVYLSPQLLANFEPGDNRRFNRNWVDSVKVGSVIYYFPYKYKVGKNATITSLSQLTEYLTILRLSEQYLIRAEARAQQNNIAGALADLNAIRNRAGLSNSTAGDKDALLEAILHERQVELFSEWGHRWFDLKRTGKVDAVLSMVRPLKAKGAPWQSWMQVYPILYDDMLKDPNLSQNTGY